MVHVDSTAREQTVDTVEKPLVARMPELFSAPVTMLAIGAFVVRRARR